MSLEDARKKMDAEWRMGESVPTRRHWFRELRDAVRYILSAVEGKHKKKSERGLSNLRVVQLAFAVGFLHYWPETWTPSTVTAMALILLAPSIDALLAKVPVAESVGAVEAVFGWLAARGQAGAAERMQTVRGTMSPWRQPTPPNADEPRGD